MQTHMYKGQISLCKKQNYTLIKSKSGDGEEGEINTHWLSVGQAEVLSIWYILLLNLIPVALLWDRYSYATIQMTKRRLREVKELVQGHTVNELPRWGCNLCLSKTPGVALGLIWWWLACRSWDGAWGPPSPSLCQHMWGSQVSLHHISSYTGAKGQGGISTYPRHQSSSETGQGRMDALSDFWSMTEQDSDRQGVREKWGSQGQTLRAWALYPRSCFLPESPDLPPEDITAVVAIHLPDQLGSTPQHVRADLRNSPKPARALLQWATLLQSLGEGGTPLHVPQFLYKQKWGCVSMSNSEKS